jgi:GH25 family lysozyme M1 (1,4-beta-N-acetylmuramidase)
MPSLRRVLHLPDVSEYQPNVDFDRVVATQRRRWLRRRNRGGAAIVRVHNGYRVDNAWHGGARRAAAHKAGVKALGLYLYLPASANVRSAVNGFVAAVGRLLPGEFAVLDVEEGAGDQSKRAKLALRLLNRRLTYPGYHGAWLYSYGSFLAAHGLLALFESVRGWIASYGAVEPASPRHVLWQHSSAEDWPGIGRCDCSIFRGSLAALLRAVYTPPKKARKRGGVTHTTTAHPPAKRRPAPAPVPAKPRRVTVVAPATIARLIAQFPQLVRAYVTSHPQELKHDAAVFAAAFAATGTVGHGPVSVSALAAAAAVAARRVLTDVAPRFIRWAVRRLTA